MYDFLVVDVDEPLDEMIEIVLDFHLCDPFSLLHHFVESVVTAQLQDNIDVLAVLEDVVEKQYVFVL
jgi:hypothetical protein